MLELVHAGDLLGEYAAVDGLAGDVPKKGRPEGIDVDGKRYDLREASSLQDGR